MHTTLSPIDSGAGTAYRPLTEDSLAAYLRTRPVLSRRLGGHPSEWRAEERGDGNLNLVFVVTGPAAGLVLKQALPYVRMVGASWPLPLSRSHFEHAALLEHAKCAGTFLPTVYEADPGMALFAMEYLASHTVLRKALAAARPFPCVGQHLGEYAARIAFHTSDLHRSPEEKRGLMAKFLGNSAMCKITEDLIFDEPYFAAPMNRHTSPQLDRVACALRADAALKLEVQEMKWCFVTRSECLIHGDLHTGSIMVSATDSRVIDPEFACYGPIGFDLGVLVANFLMACVSQTGHESRSGERTQFREHLLEQTGRVWHSFAQTFASLWRTRGQGLGAVFNPRLNADVPALDAAALERRLQHIWKQLLGFAGCEIIRRIVGLSHVADFETIADPSRRADCERRAVELARDLLVNRSRFRSIEQIADAVRGGA